MLVIFPTRSFVPEFHFGPYLGSSRTQKELSMIPVVPKALAVDRQGNQYGMEFRLALGKYRGWFDHVTLERSSHR